MLQANTVTGWVVKGLGGAANMIAALSADHCLIDGDQLKQLRSIVVQLASHYNFHAKRSSLEPHEVRPFWGASDQLGEPSSGTRLDESQPIPVIAEPPAVSDPEQND